MKTARRNRAEPRRSSARPPTIAGGNHGRAGELDRALGEFEAGIDALESGEYEFLNEQESYGEQEWSGEQEWAGEQEWSGEQEAVFDEIQEMELAAELLEVASDSSSGLVMADEV